MPYRGDPQFYGDFVQSVADDAPVVGSWNVDWQAFMAVGFEEIAERTGIGDVDESVPIYRVDGELFVDGYQGFYEATLIGFSIALTEIGTTQTRVAWTGSLTNGRLGRAPNGDPLRLVFVGDPLSSDSFCII